jgi:hypothetical protein
MRKKHYLPKGDKNREAWLNNFAIEFEEVALKLGFTAEEITEVKNFAAAYVYVLKTMNIIKSEEHEWTQYKELLADGEIGSQLGSFPVLPTMPVAPTVVPAGIFKSIAKVVQRIKNHPNYDKSIGKTLGIIGPEKVIDSDNAKVPVTLHRCDNDGVVLNFVKDVYDGVIIYGGTIEAKTTVPAGSEASIGEEPVMTWEEIGRVAVSPFVDTRVNQTNKPETRYYRMRYIVKQSPIGKVSDTITVISTVGIDLANKVK